MTPSAKELFPARLRALREASGLTQTALAERAGMASNTISQLEAAKREPLWSTVAALAQALGVDCTAFLAAPPPQPAPSPA